MCERRLCGISFIIRSGNSNCAYGDRVCRAHDDLLCWYVRAYVTNTLLYCVYGWCLPSRAALTLFHCEKLVLKSFFFLMEAPWGGGESILEQRASCPPININVAKKKNYGYLSKISSFVFLKCLFMYRLKISVSLSPHLNVHVFMSTRVLKSSSVPPSIIVIKRCDKTCATAW